MPELLTTASTILCPHGGQAILTTANARVTAGAAVLLESDVHAVAGCPFTVGPRYSPCVRIEWAAGAAASSVDGTAPLTRASVGKCLSAESAPQGVALIAATQPRAQSR